MATRKIPEFAFGGVDSRSNPVNFPSNRALRCLNFAPQASGALRLRAGYTVPMQATNDTVGATTIHSLLYYEEFSANYLGPQFALYGKGPNIEQFNLSTQASTLIGEFTTTNPWGHFRSKNRIFISDGTTQYNWDGSNLRVSGLPAASDIGGPFPSAYGGTAISTTGSTVYAWSNPGNIDGPPDGMYATAISDESDVTNTLKVTGYGFSVATDLMISRAKLSITGHQVNTAGQPGVLFVQFTAFGAPAGPVQFITVSSGGDALIVFDDPALGGSLTPAIVNDPSFGFVIYGSATSLGGTSTFGLDSAEISFYVARNIGTVTVSVVSSSLGSFTPTLLTGYQLYVAIYDTVTQHMGNRGPIGGPVTVGNTLSAIILEGLPDPRTLATGLNVPSSELVLAVGMTMDGAGIPYWLTDAQGNDIIVANGASVATITIGLTNVSQELPINNNVPPPMDKFARVGTRTFGNLSGSPFLQYSNDEADVSNADYVGNPEESWPPNQQEPLPTGELPTSIHGWRLEGWFFSRNSLCIWSNFLLQQGVNPWRGPWPGGCCGQRAFVETPYGPFWVSPQKQLCTFMEDGVISVSDEYEASLIGQIASANLGSVEIGYLLSPGELIDQIFIKGTDGNGNPVSVIHDFRLEDERSPHGQGYDYSYTNLSVQTFAGAGFTPRQNVYDTNGVMRLWAGSQQGFIAQLEDGVTDNGANFTGDYIGLIALGPNRPGLASLEVQGDGDNIVFNWTKDYSLGLDDWAQSVPQLVPGESSVWEFPMYGEGRWLYVRMQLESDATSYALGDPPYVPLPTTGYVNQATLKLGTDRPEAV